MKRGREILEEQITEQIASYKPGGSPYHNAHIVARRRELNKKKPMFQGPNVK